ncbi:hypothetical protein ACA910_008451 [Epithemia clementina (nom. ined.)]
MKSPIKSPINSKSRLAALLLFRKSSPFSSNSSNNLSPKEKNLPKSLLLSELDGESSDSSTVDITTSILKIKSAHASSRCHDKNNNNHNNHKKGTHKRRLQQQQRHVVRFEEEWNQYHDSSFIQVAAAKEEKEKEEEVDEETGPDKHILQASQLWYNGDECKQMKHKNHVFTQRMLRNNRQRRQQPHDGWLDGSENSESSLDSVVLLSEQDDEGTPDALEALVSMYQACSGLETGASSRQSIRMSLVRQVARYLEASPYSLGLEHALARSSKDNQKKERRRQLLQVVYNLPHNSSSSSNSNSSNNSNMDDTSADMAERLRGKCKDITRPARLFAMALGQAHQVLAAAQYEEELH